MKKISRQIYIFPPIMVMSLYFTALGFLVPIIQDKFLLSSAQVGLFSTMQSIGTMAALLVCFFVVSAMNKSRVLLISAFLFAAGLIVLAFGGSALTLYLLFVFIGLFSGIATTISNSLIVEGGSRHAGYYIGILHGVWAAMAALGPFFVLLFNDNYKNTLLCLGILAAAMLVVYAVGYRENLKMPGWEDKSRVGSLKKLMWTFKYKGMIALLAVGFFTTIIRSGFTFFLRSYIEYLGRQPIFGAYMIGVFFIGMFLGRMIYGRISGRVSSSRVLLITNTAAGAAYLAMVLVDNMTAFLVLMSIGALCIASNVPIIITKAYEIMPGDTTAATSFVFISMVVGALVGPPVIGWLSDVLNIRIAMLVCISTLLPVIALALRMLMNERRAQA